MKDGTQANVNSNREDWESLDKNLKLILLGALALTAIGIMTAFGPQALYLLMAATALGAFALYPDEIEPEPILWGAVIGALVAGPLGIIIGAGLGHYLWKRYNAFMNWIDPIVNTFRTTTAPLMSGANTAVLAINSVTNNITTTVSTGFNLLQRAKTAISNVFTNNNTTDNVDNEPKNENESSPGDPLSEDPISKDQPDTQPQTHVVSSPRSYVPVQTETQPVVSKKTESKKTEDLSENALKQPKTLQFTTKEKKINKPTTPATTTPKNQDHREVLKKYNRFREL